MQRKRVLAANDTSAVDEVIDGALSGAALGVKHVTYTISCMILTASLATAIDPVVKSCKAVLGAETTDSTLCKLVETSLSGAFHGSGLATVLHMSLEFVIASCATALGVPAVSNDPVVDVVAKVTLVGAAAGASYSALRFFTNRDNQAEDKPERYLDPNRDRPCSAR